MAPSAQLDNTRAPTSAAMDLLDMFDTPMGDSWTQLDGQTHDAKATSRESHLAFSNGKVLTPSSSSSPSSSSATTSSSSQHIFGRAEITPHGASPSQGSSSATPRASEDTASHSCRDPIKKDNPFILVLVDFHASELCKGREGAFSAVDAMWGMVLDEIPWYHGQPCQIIFRIYADFRRLAKRLTPQGPTQACLDQIRSFASGMNSQDGVDFFDAGSEPGAVLRKIKEHLGFFSTHPDCQDVVLGSHQSDWTSLIEIDGREKLRIQFNLLFIHDNLKAPLPSDWKECWHVDLSGVFQYNSQRSTNSASSTNPDTTTPTAATATSSKHSSKAVLVNSKNQRVDPQLAPYTFDEWQLYHNIKRTKQPCRYFHLSKCTSKDCQYDYGRLPEAMMLVLLHITRATPCDVGPSCRDPECPYGHHCSKVGCEHRKCRFPPAVHGDAFDPLKATATSDNPIAKAVATTTTTIAPRLAATARMPETTSISSSSGPNTTPALDRVPTNSNKQRIDPLIPRPSRMDMTRFMQLQKSSKRPCQSFYLSQCSSPDCGLDHTPLDANITNIFAIGARQIPCEKGSECRDEGCILGHHCQVRYCDNKDCKFPAALHNLDMTTVQPPAAPAATATATILPRPRRKVVRTTWSSKPKDTIEHVSAANAARPGAQHAGSDKKQNRHNSRQTTPSQRSSSPGRASRQSDKSITNWQAFAEASAADHKRPQHTQNATANASTPLVTTAAPAGFDLIDFDYEDRLEATSEQEKAVESAAALRRNAMARSGTSSPAHPRSEQSSARSVPDLLDTAEVSAESSDELPPPTAAAEADTMFKDIAQLMTGNFFGTLHNKPATTPTPAATKFGAFGSRVRGGPAVADDNVRPWLDTFDVVDDVDLYAQQMIDREYQQRIDSDVESEL